MVKPKLLVIPNDPLKAYDKKGYSRKERYNYYNPNSEFEVAFLGVEENSETPFEFSGFKVFPSDRNLKGIKEVMEKVKPDLVRAYNGAWAAELSGKIGGEYNIPSIASVHNMFPEKGAKDVDRVFCASETVKKRCLEVGIDEGKIDLVYDGIDLTLFKNCEDSSELNHLNEQYSEKYKIISVGRLTWQKNLENLVKASKLVHDKLPGLLHLHIGNLGNAKEKIAEKVKLVKANHIQFITNVSQDKLPYFYSWADAFTMASVSEGFGLVYIEALACRTPVVTSDIQPMNDYIKNKYNGLLANPESSEDIAEKIYEILTNNSLYEKLQSNARKSVEKFDIRKLKKQEARLYKKLL